MAEGFHLSMPLFVLSPDSCMSCASHLSLLMATVMQQWYQQCAASACAACDFLASLILYCCLMGLVHGEKYGESASSCPRQPGASYIISWSLSHILMTAMCVQLLRGLMKVMCVQLLRGLYVNYLAHACPTITYIPLVITKGAREG